MSKDYLSNIDIKTIFKVINVDNKESERNPSPLFIISSLQQEASTKLLFNYVASTNGLVTLGE